MCRVRFQRTRDESEREYRRWIRTNYGRDREDDDGTTPEPEPGPEIGNTLKAIIAAYIAAEHERVRPDEAERNQGTIGIAEYWDIRHQALKIGLWAKEHFGDRFETVAFGDLMDISDCDAMMLHFIQHLHYAKTRVNKTRRRFWDIVRFAKGRPFRQQLTFLSMTWTRNTRWNDWAALSEGCYLLRTNLTDTDPATLWKRYTQLTEAEWAFRIHKDELEIRPVFHQKPDRVLAHILICFLAYVLWKALAQWMRGAGLGDAPRTLMEEFAKIKSGDVVLPTVTGDGRPGKTVYVRCVTTPDRAQRVLLNRLGLTLPQRLRYLEEVTQM
ncbi:MAG: hypothetical protein KA354_24875 [Phycisphaerae bacterium]|nr:hypothetical protein [Phycisphaerae bacterium]